MMPPVLPNTESFSSWERGGAPVAGLADPFEVDDSMLDSLAEMVDSGGQFGLQGDDVSAGDLEDDDRAASFMQLEGGHAGMDFSFGLLQPQQHGLTPMPSYAPTISESKMPGPVVSLKPGGSDGSYSWESVQLVIVKHSVHKVVGTGPDRDYIVSNLRPFTIDLQLVDISGSQPAECYNNLQLRSSLYYENGLPVRAPPSETLLLGDTQAMVVRGHGQLKLKMGINALSSKLGKQRLRVKIEPANEDLRALPMLSVLTEPLRSVTKLERKPASRGDKDGGSTNSSAAGAAPPTPTGAPSSDPFATVGESEGPLMVEGSNRISTTSATSSSWAEGGVSESISRQGSNSAGAAAAPKIEASSSGAAASSTPAIQLPPIPASEDVNSLKALLLQERELFQQQVTALRNQLSDEHSDNASIRKVLEMQQRQMQLMAKQNESILHEVASLRSSRLAEQQAAAASAPASESS